MEVATEREFQAAKGWDSRSHSPHSHNPHLAASQTFTEEDLQPSHPPSAPHWPPPRVVILGPLVPPGGKNWYRT